MIELISEDEILKETNKQIEEELISTSKSSSYWGWLVRNIQINMKARHKELVEKYILETTIENKLALLRCEYWEFDNKYYWLSIKPGICCCIRYTNRYLVTHVQVWKSNSKGTCSILHECIRNQRDFDMYIDKIFKFDYSKINIGNDSKVIKSYRRKQ